MLRPFLLVGVGGSGGKTLRAMRQSLLRRIRQVGWTGDDLPAGWQTLWIDKAPKQNWGSPGMSVGLKRPRFDAASLCV